MKKIFLGVLLSSMLVFLLAACGNDESEANGSKDNGETNTEAEDGSSDDLLQVVTSFTIIADVANEIGGDDVDIHNLVPTGTDPHEYEPLPEDIKKATDADILFYNGLNLEGGEQGWFFKMVDAVHQDEDKIFSVTEQVEPMYLSGEDGQKEEINPHTFINPENGIKMAEDMRDAFVKIDPDHADAYEERAEAYLDRLAEVNEEYHEQLGDLPEEDRYLVTSERAFQYLADEYDLEEGFIWEIDTEENGSPKQIKNLVGFLKDNEVPILFVESNVDERPMETVSKESGVDIYEKPIYSDEIGAKGDEVDTYMKYLNYNIDILSKGLNQ